VAWLNAIPKDKNGKGEQSRLDRMTAKGERPLLPVNPAPHLTEWLFDIGPSSPGSMGDAALGYQDMAAWQAISGVELLPWEARTLRRLSGEYLVGRHAAEDQACPPPYAGEVDDLVAKRSHVAKQVRSAFANLKRKE
jgi:hypothetical protein